MTDKSFTAVFLNVTTEEAGEITSHPKWSAGSWSHALNDRDEARALLSSSKPAAPDGWKLVPVALTNEMYNATGMVKDAPFELWKRLLAAAPAAPAQSIFTESRLKIAEECNERLMNACMDAGCPDGVDMADWIRKSCSAPAQSGEPVAWLIERCDALAESTATKEFADLMRRNGHKVTPLYAAPQPQPTSAVAMDEREATVPQTFAGFAASHVNATGYMPSKQETFDAGVRAGKARAASRQATALYTMAQMRDYADAFHQSRVEATATQPEWAQRALTDEQITNVWNSMPFGYDGFLKYWGYIQFARALLTAAQQASGGDRAP